MKYFQAIKKPVLTEKSMQKLTQNCYLFLVDKKATKHQIGKAVAEAFNVKVESVRTLIIKGKSRRSGRRRQAIQLPSQKKAFVCLKEGEKIEEFETQK